MATTTIQEELAQVRTDMGLTHDWVQGGDTATVQLGNVATPTIRNAVRQFLASGGVNAYTTKAQLNADRTPAANSLAIVTDDSTVANNGYYVKSGASGSGSWTKIDYDVVSEHDLDAAMQEHAADIAAVAQAHNADIAAAAKALLDIRTDGPFYPLFITPEVPSLRAACIDADGRILADIDAEGTYRRHLPLDDEPMSFILPDFEELRHAVIDADGRILADVDASGACRSHLPSDESMAFISPENPDLQHAVIDADGRILKSFPVPQDELGFISPGALGTRFRLLDDDGRETVRIDDDGGLFSAGWARNPMPYVADGTLKAVVDGEDVPLLRFPAAEILAAESLNRQAVRVAVKRADGGVLTGVVGVDGVALPAMGDKTLHCFLLTGQSLAVGMTATDLWTTEPPSADLALMLANSSGTPDIRMGVYYKALAETAEIAGFQYSEPGTPVSLTGFQPVRAWARDSSRGQTPLESMAEAVARAELEAGLNFRTLWIVSGVGGRGYQFMKKCAAADKNATNGAGLVYDNAITAITRASEFAAARGWSLAVDGIIIKHGEQDADDGMSAADYYAALLVGQSDYNTDIKAITGQERDIPFLIGAFQTWLDPASNSGRDGHGSISAMLRAHVEHPDKFRVISNDYPILPAYTTDMRHMTGKGYAILGEIWARNVLQACYFGGCECVRFKTAVRSGATVTISVAVPAPPLAFDTAQVSERDGTKYGMRYFDGEDEIAISSASITDDGGNGTGTITLELASAPSGDSTETLTVAWDGMTATRRNYPETLPRANIRDSAGAIHRSRVDGRRLDNWIVPQAITVTVNS